MKNILLTIIAIITIAVLAGCMTDREYMLRKSNADNQAMRHLAQAMVHPADA